MSPKIWKGKNRTYPKKLTGVAGGLGEIRSGGSVQCAVCCVLWCALCTVLCAVCSVQCAVCSVLCAVCSVQCAVVSAACWGRTTNDHLHSHTEWRHTISNEECFLTFAIVLLIDWIFLPTIWTSIIKVFSFLHRMTSQGLFPPLDTIASRWTWAVVAKFGHFLDICRTL